MRMTITEALAQLKTIQKRVESKHKFVLQYLVRDERLKDPLERDGGSIEQVRRELQSIRDLEERVVQIRTKIQEANHRIQITVNGTSRTIMQWLAWRKEVAPGQQLFLETVAAKIAQARREAQSKGMGVMVGANVKVGDEKLPQMLVNLDERAFMSDQERVHELLGTLDGQLSLKNATETIELEELPG